MATRAMSQWFQRRTAAGVPVDVPVERPAVPQYSPEQLSARSFLAASSGRSSGLDDVGVQVIGEKKKNGEEGKAKTTKGNGTTSSPRIVKARSGHTMNAMAVGEPKLYQSFPIIPIGAGPTTSPQLKAVAPIPLSFDPSMITELRVPSVNLDHVTTVMAPFIMFLTMTAGKLGYSRIELLFVSSNLSQTIRDQRTRLDNAVDNLEGCLSSPDLCGLRSRYVREEEEFRQKELGLGEISPVKQEAEIKEETGKGKQKIREEAGTSASQEKMSMPVQTTTEMGTSTPLLLILRALLNHSSSSLLRDILFVERSLEHFRTPFLDALEQNGLVFLKPVIVTGIGEVVATMNQAVQLSPGRRVFNSLRSDILTIWDIINPECYVDAQTHAITQSAAVEIVAFEARRFRPEGGLSKQIITNRAQETSLEAVAVARMRINRLTVVNGRIGYARNPWREQEAVAMANKLHEARMYMSQPSGMLW